MLVGPKSRGSNMHALVAAGRDPDYPAEVVLVVAHAPDAPALDVAAGHGIATASHAADPDFGPWLLDALQACAVRWICLAGYLRLLPPDVVAAYRGLILNIHPALLPRHGGKGMYGRRVHETVLASGDEESGVTVHLVDEVYDNGDVVLQLRCPVEPTDTPETLAERVLALEHRAFPEALKQVIERERARAR